MKRMFLRGAVGAFLTFGAASLASAQVLVAIPDTSQTTTLTATVSDQATVTTPSNVTFNVTNVSSTTAGSTAALSITGIVLPQAADVLKVSLKAEAASFTPPVALATTWSATDVSWTGGTWTNGTPNPAALTSAAYTEVGRCTNDVSSCSTTNVTFTLAAKPTVTRSGDHTLVIRWKFEKI